MVENKYLEVPIILPSHGNSKKQATPYQRTQTSTLQKMKGMKGTPKSVVSLLHEEAGGSIGVSSATLVSLTRPFTNRSTGCITSPACARKGLVTVRWTFCCNPQECEL